MVWSWGALGGSVMPHVQTLFSQQVASWHWNAPPWSGPSLKLRREYQRGFLHSCIIQPWGPSHPGTGLGRPAPWKDHAKSSPVQHSTQSEWVSPPQVSYDPGVGALNDKAVHGQAELHQA